MDTKEVTRTIELLDDADINQYLKLGWRMINTYNKPLDLEHPIYNCHIQHVLMGWFGPNPKFPDNGEK